MRRFGFGISVAAMAIIAGACSKDPPPRQPKVPVTVTAAKSSTVPYVVKTNGVVEPMQTVAVQAQVTGILNRVTFSEGKDVEAGQVLFQIDSRPYVATLQ